MVGTSVECRDHITLSTAALFSFNLHRFPTTFVGKLKKWNTVDEVHKTMVIPEAPNRKTGPVISGALPPPPPPPPLPGGLKPPPIHLMKPLHVVTGPEEPPSPESSSFYSPGGTRTSAGTCRS